MPKLYHRTEHPDEIMRGGFLDGSWPDLGGDGVCLGSTITATLAGHGDWIIEVDVPEAFLDKYRMKDATGPYDDMFFAPATVLCSFHREKHFAPRPAH